MIERVPPTFRRKKSLPGAGREPGTSHVGAPRATLAPKPARIQIHTFFYMSILQCYMYGRREERDCACAGDWNRTKIRDAEGVITYKFIDYG